MKKSYFRKRKDGTKYLVTIYKNPVTGKFWSKDEALAFEEFKKLAKPTLKKRLGEKGLFEEFKHFPEITAQLEDDNIPKTQRKKIQDAINKKIAELQNAGKRVEIETSKTIQETTVKNGKKKGRRFFEEIVLVYMNDEPHLITVDKDYNVTVVNVKRKKKRSKKKRKK